MPRWFQVALTLVLYSAALWAVAWVMKRVIPIAHGWIVSGVGHGGAWALLIGLWLAGVLYLYRDSRRRRR